MRGHDGCVAHHLLAASLATRGSQGEEVDSQEGVGDNQGVGDREML